ncbi:tRNA (adenosine(37)-N6)-threonylcarbamoyltransferase complex transferase subunit TsaD [Magnetococcales bacterium HHB-1]
MLILGIETSCDETAAAVIKDNKILSNVVHSQLALHAQYGGVVPELASRAHIRNISSVIEAAIKTSGYRYSDLDGIAVTRGPGLVGALLVGIATAKGLSLALNRPLLAVHHLEGHLISPFLDSQAILPQTTIDQTEIDYPFIALLVSGGHTLLLYVEKFGHYRLLGQTQDDAVGEAFDKGARLLDLPYPGGPAISKLSLQGDNKAVPFPRVLLDRKKFNFSYSGLKTALRVFLLKNPQFAKEPHLRQDLAASYQEALIQPLVIKSIAACKKYQCQHLIIAGGVGANLRLREALKQQADQYSLHTHFPPIPLCADNGAMIALAGGLRLAKGENHGIHWNAQPRWPIETLS